jgi:surfactin synthase thioesterase subunit
MLDIYEAELTAEVTTSIRDVGKNPHPELVSIYVRILRDDIELRRGYTASSPLRLACGITAFSWREDGEYPPHRMAGWAECGETTFEVFPGRHERFRDAPAELIDTICAALLS